MTADDLMRQAPMTIELYLHEAIHLLDIKFGEGYAKKNPMLVGTLVHAMTQDFETASATMLRGVADGLDPPETP